MKTLKYLVGAAAALAMLGTADSALAAADNVTDSLHNLSTTTATGVTRTNFLTAGEDEVCVFCHTPHAEAGSVTPLWNRTLPAGSAFTMYDVDISSTMDMTVNADPRGVSLACLSCHDGVQALDALLNQPGSGSTPDGANAWNTTNKIAAGVTNLGVNLSNDHPISLTYDNTADGDGTNFKTVSAITSTTVSPEEGGITLYTVSGDADQMECGSCHNPHNTSNPTFLRKSNAASALCLTCHVK